MKEAKIKALQEVLSIFKELNPEMNVNMMLTFLEVAKNKGISGIEVEEKLNLRHATAARLMRYYDRYQSNDRDGLDMFRVEYDPRDYKVKMRYLNDNGVAFLKRLEEATKHL
jgi:CRISPR/Cas system-associated protein Cas5 (RAMP superfamily)